MASSRFLVCVFVLPRPIVRIADLATCIAQEIASHVGAEVIIKATRDRSGLRVFTKDADRIGDIRVAVDTNREDWRNAGVSEIRSAA